MLVHLARPRRGRSCKGLHLTARRLRGLRREPGRSPTVRRLAQLARRRSDAGSPAMGRIWIGTTMGWGVSRTGAGSVWPKRVICASASALAALMRREQSQHGPGRTWNRS